MIHTKYIPGPDSRAWRIALIYAVVSLLWIWFSDQALLLVYSDPGAVVKWSVYKGMAFVLLSSLMLWLLIRHALLQLRESRHRLASVVDSAMDAILVVDARERVTFANRTAERMFGVDGNDMVGRMAATFFELDDSGSEPGHLAAVGVRARGERFPLEATRSNSGPGEDEAVTYVLRDVTERRNYETEIARLNRLHEARSRINQAMLDMPDRAGFLESVCRILVEQGHVDRARIWKANDDGALQEWPVTAWPASQLFPRMLERLGERIVCNHVLEDPAMASWTDALRAHDIQSIASLPIYYDDRDWGVLTVFSCTPDYFRDRELELFDEVVSDISLALDLAARSDARKQAEEALREEMRVTDSMIESMPGIVYFYDMSGQFLRWNENFERVTGYAAKELRNKHPLDFFRGDDVDRVHERIQRVFEVGESNVEALFTAKDGSQIPFFFTGRRVMYRQSPCLIGIGIDISDRTRMEKELRELNRTLEARISARTADLQLALVRAEEADQMKSAFLATMSHELRTPLNSIIGFTGILLQGLAGELNEEQRKQLGMVQASARHLLALINDVLDLSKIEAGQLSVSRSEFSVPELLEKVIRTVRPMAEKKGLSLELEVASDVGTFLSDARRVEQILLNLVNNAIKFTDKGGVTVRAARTRASIEIHVVDTGIGIEEEDRERLFSPFVQIDSGLSRKHEGTGLGLAICQRLAAMLDGEVVVDSTWQEGSTFSLVLPA